MEKWSVKNVKFNIEKIVREVSISPIVAKLLANREIYEVEEAKEFLNPSFRNLNKPKELKDLMKSIEIIKNSIANKEKILIVGDYDVDGVMATYILFKGLSRCSANVSYHIPDRILEGYGINDSIIKKAKEEKVDLIITCDNGIAAIEQVKLAKEFGIKVIITDHHDVYFIEKDTGEREDVIPIADSIINPKQKDCFYPFDKICGATIAFKLVAQLYKEYNIESLEFIDLIQYVAIATVCDVVDLVKENRILVKKGLEIINKTNNIGLKALFKETGLDKKEITSYSLGFVIGPSINATGRLEQATIALDLLLSNDVKEAEDLAKKLNELNKERQDLTKAGIDLAISEIEQNNMNKDNKVLVVYLKEIHESIAGIIAGRIREKYNLPVIILTKAHEGVKGSGRSIEEYNMFEELLKCKDLLGKFGGHPMAAGMSLKEEDVNEFRKRLNDLTSLSDDDVIPKILIDSGIQLRDIDYNLINEISLLEPYGKSNSKPNFGIKNLKVLGAKILGEKRNVLKLTLSDGSRFIDSVYFGDIDGFEESLLKKYGQDEYNKVFSRKSNSIFLDIICFPNINEYNGNKTIQLIISNYRFSEK